MKAKKDESWLLKGSIGAFVKGNERALVCLAGREVIDPYFAAHREGKATYDAEQEENILVVSDDPNAVTFVYVHC
ncbi:MAG: hypothetical protein IMHGJWDQ_001009 [Candidatus Fervidibacter sp.]